MCLQEEETVHHMLIHCKFASKVWSFVLYCFDMKWVMPGIVECSYLVFMMFFMLLC